MDPRRLPGERGGRREREGHMGCVQAAVAVAVASCPSLCTGEQVFVTEVLPRLVTASCRVLLRPALQAAPDRAGPPPLPGPPQSRPVLRSLFTTTFRRSRSPGSRSGRRCLRRRRRRVSTGAGVRGNVGRGAAAAPGVRAGARGALGASGTRAAAMSVGPATAPHPGHRPHGPRRPPLSAQRRTRPTTLGEGAGHRRPHGVCVHACVTPRPASSTDGRGLGGDA